MVCLVKVSALAGVKVLELLDYGGCGKVYLGVDDLGETRAVKVLDESSVNRSLLAKMTHKLRSHSWPKGVVPVLAEHFGKSPIYQVMPWLADQSDSGQWIPRSLQYHLDQYSRSETWRIIQELASALDEMHSRHVAHGNLKPGNIFIDQQDHVLVSDWCLGNMPGVNDFNFTDALLYQAPEQLVDPSGYFDEAGYGWDVYAFGFIAYRMLTGMFPRCDGVFQKVSPARGVIRCDGIKAETNIIARNLTKCRISEWPEEAKDPLEFELRKWIIRCLEIDPADRPRSMVEVLSGFEITRKEVVEESERQGRARFLRRTRLSMIVLRCVGGLALLGALASGFAWKRVNDQLNAVRAQMHQDRLVLESNATSARAGQVRAEAHALEVESRLNQEIESRLKQLEAARWIGDQLLGWALESERHHLPVIEGRELRLKQLERYYENFLEESKSLANLADECVRARWHLAEISMANGNVGMATQRMQEAKAASKGWEMDAQMKLRLATNWLWLALLKEKQADAGAGDAFVIARNAFENISRDEVDVDRMDQLLATLDFYEARLMISKGKEAGKLEQLMRATKTLHRLASQRPDRAVLRSELAAFYLATAEILEGIGTVGDAREVRILASEELLKLLKEMPDHLSVKMDMARCYSEMAEASVLSGDDEGAEEKSKQALVLLDECLSVRPLDHDAWVQKAGQLILRAGLAKDRGLADQAKATYDEAAKILTSVHAKKPGHVMASYQLVQLWWQHGRLLGMEGQRDVEITMIRKAGDLLVEIQSDAAQVGILPEQLMRTQAYLTGDLGHALQQASNNPEAREVFGKAVSLWTRLKEMRPASEEYQEGLQWCEQRLTDLK